MIMTDASAYGLGTVFLQLQKEDKWASLSVVSPLSKKAGLDYASAEREGVMTAHCLQRRRSYLRGEFFSAVTNYISLEKLMRCRDCREKLAMWDTEILDFDLVIEHKNGTEPAVP